MARDYVTETLMGEALGEGELGMRAVAEVIKNRAAERGLSPEQVVLQPKQFSFWNNPITSQTFLKKNGSKDNYAKAKKVWDAVIAGQNELVGNSNLYHVATMKKFPSWAKSKNVKKVTQVGNHIFYQES